MPATNHTSHYDLSQYIDNDIPSYLNDYNTDMEKIDNAIYEASQSNGEGKEIVITNPVFYEDIQHNNAHEFIGNLILNFQSNYIEIQGNINNKNSQNTNKWLYLDLNEYGTFPNTDVQTLGAINLNGWSGSSIGRANTQISDNHIRLFISMWGNAINIINGRLYY